MALTGLGSKGSAKRNRNDQYTIVAAFPGQKSKTFTVTAEGRNEAGAAAREILREQGLLDDMVAMFIRLPSPPGLE